MSAGREHTGGGDIELRQVLDMLPVGVVAFTPDGLVAFINQQAADWLSLTAEDIEGQPIDSDHWEVLNLDGTEMPPEDYALSKVLATGQSVTDDRARLRIAGGREFNITTSARPLFDADGNVSFVIGTFEDVSETRTRETELEASNHHLESFAGVLSHDLRSPLSVAAGYLDLARETGDLSYLDRVERAHDRMRTLIDDLLVLARHGEDIGTRVDLDVAAIARDAWENVETDDVRLVTEPVHIDGDPSRLTQLFENLFRNVREHAAPDATVRVGPTADGFYVADDGDGLPTGVRKAVNDGTVRDRPGLGLSIVAAIAAGHHWEFTATTSDDGGARFEFYQ